MITPRPSSVARPSTPLNVFFSETPGPHLFNFHVEPSVKGGLKIYTNCHCTLIKMAAMPIYGKTLEKYSFKNHENFNAKSWYVALGTQVCLYDDPSCHLTFFTGRSSLCPYAFLWGKY